MLVCVTREEDSIVEEEEEEEHSNKMVAVNIVKALYEALTSRDVDTVHRLLAPQIEWWFHGPRSHHEHMHMMRLLTGAATSSPVGDSFVFEPLSIVAFGSTVLVEGCYINNKYSAGSLSWVHAWTVTHGIITEVREYINTSLTVTRLGNSTVTMNSSSSSSSTTTACQSLWQSKLCDNSSVPGLILAL